MKEQRKRLHDLLSAAEHPLRTAEHTVFSRLLYRNTNQHRHAPYFRKLRHVRRLLHHLSVHNVWASVRAALADHPPNSKAPLALSSITLDDVSDARNLAHTLVHNIIPEAAQAVAVELVARAHFLAFAVAIEAALARLFVVERAVRDALAGVATELSVLLAEPELDNATVEDVGCELPQFPRPSEVEQNVKSLHDERVDHPQKKPRHVTNALFEDVPDTTSPSLYHVSHASGRRQSVDAVSARAVVALPELPVQPTVRTGGATLGKRARESSAAGMESSIGVGARGEDCGADNAKLPPVPTASPAPMRSDASASPRSAEKSQPGKPVMSGGGSDSDSLDDIFDALDD